MVYGIAVSSAPPNVDVEANERTPLLGTRSFPTSASASTSTTPPPASTPPPTPTPTPTYRHIPPPIPKRHIFFAFFLGFILVAGSIIGAYLIVTQDLGWIIGSSFELVNRERWHAINQTPILTRSDAFLEPAKYVIITQTEGRNCTNKFACKTLMRELQAETMNNTMHDIKYNFLIGGDGRTYEGRGWAAKDGLTHDLKGLSISIAVIGHFWKTAPSAIQMKAIKGVIIESIRRKKLRPKYILIGEFQINGSESAANDGLMRKIQKWDYWKKCYRDC